MDKILRINVGAMEGPVYKVEPLGKYQGMGGRGMTSMVVNEEVPADCHALGPENKLVFAPGLLAGSAASTSGRLSVGCKSPLTGGIKEANGGDFPVLVKMTGDEYTPGGIEIEEALERCRKAKDTSQEPSEIKSAVENLTGKSHKLAEHLYKGAGAQPGAEAGAGTGASGAGAQAGAKGPEEEVVEAEFEDVDKDKK